MNARRLREHRPRRVVGEEGRGHEYALGSRGRLESAPAGGAKVMLLGEDGGERVAAVFDFDRSEEAAELAW